jgi:hypothetical protein
MKIAILETKLVDYAKDVKDGIEAAAGDAVKIAAFMQANQAKIVALASIAGPEAAAIATTGSGLLNLVITAVKDAGTAASSNGLSVSLDSATIADVKAVIAAIEKI